MSWVNPALKPGSMTSYLLEIKHIKEQMPAYAAGSSAIAFI